MTQKHAIAKSSDISNESLFSTTVEGKKVLLVRVEGNLSAFSAKCPHLGLSLAKGTVENGTIKCPWHGAKFDMCTGENLDWANAVAGMSVPKWMHGMLALGKKPAPLCLHKTSEKDGTVYLELTPT